MVKQTRIIFELGDIVAIRIQCTECKGEILIRLDADHHHVPERCPHCDDPWRTLTHIQSAITQLRNALKYEQDNSVKMRIELDADQLEPDGKKV